jgi:lipoprotein-releasing system ATP-binding protein
MIKAENIHKSFGSIKVLRGVSLKINQGEIVSIIGTSGAGKTTLLQILGTLSKADSGTIDINNKKIKYLTEEKLSEFRNQEVGFIFQSHHLLPEFTALENVCIPAWIKNDSEKMTKKRAIDILTNLGLSERLNHKPMELSGGEQQRVAVARALINKPSVIFADEPSGNLDTDSSRTLHKLFFKLRDLYGQTFVIVTHNRDLAEMSDRMIEIKDGKIL